MKTAADVFNQYCRFHWGWNPQPKASRSLGLINVVTGVNLARGTQLNHKIQKRKEKEKNIHRIFPVLCYLLKMYTVFSKQESWTRFISNLADMYRALFPSVTLPVCWTLLLCFDFNWEYSVTWKLSISFQFLCMTVSVYPIGQGQCMHNNLILYSTTKTSMFNSAKGVHWVRRYFLKTWNETD